MHWRPSDNDGDDNDGDDIDVQGSGGGGGEGGLFDGIDDRGTGGAGNRCAGITTGVMALMLVSWQMHFKVRVGTVEVLNLWLLW
jgi:hypothetical protein